MIGVEPELAREKVARRQLDNRVLRLQQRRLAGYALARGVGDVADALHRHRALVARAPKSLASLVRHLESVSALRISLAPILEPTIRQLRRRHRGERLLRAGHAVHRHAVVVGGRARQARQRGGELAALDLHVFLVNGLPRGGVLLLVFHSGRTAARHAAVDDSPRGHREHVARGAATAARVGVDEDFPVAPRLFPREAGVEGARAREVAHGGRVGRHLAECAAEVQCLDVHVLRVECLGVHIDNHRTRVRVEHVARHALHVDVALDDLLHRHAPRVILVGAQGEVHRPGEVQPRVRRGGQAVQRGEMAEGEPLRVVAQGGVDQQRGVGGAEGEARDAQLADVHRVVDVERHRMRRVVDRGGGVRLALGRPLSLHGDIRYQPVDLRVRDVVLDGAARQKGQGQRHDISQILQQHISLSIISIKYSLLKQKVSISLFQG